METKANLLQMLDMKNHVELLMATREDLEKCKTKNHNTTDQTINEIYAKMA